MNTNEIIDFLKKEIAIFLQKSPSSIDANINFLKVGISSINTLRILNKISKKLNIDINPVAMFEYTTIKTFSEYLYLLSIGDT